MINYLVEEMKEKREKLFRIITTVLARNETFKYYQVCCVERKEFDFIIV